jgi:branched-chain amino acid transport system permease protein
MGIAVIYAGTGHFHIAHAGVFLIGGYVTQLLVVEAGLPLIVALLVGMAAAVVVGVAIDRGIYSRLEARGGGKIAIFLASLGTLYVVTNLVVIWRGNEPVYAPPVESLNTPIPLGGAALTGLQLILVVGSFILLGLLIAVLRWTRLGALIRALASNPEQIRIAGRSLASARIAVYALGSALAGLAGAYALQDSGLTVALGESYFMLAFVAVILGGVGSIQGAFWAAMLLGLIENIVQYWIPNQWADVIVFALFLITIVLAPLGLSGLRAGAGRRVRAARPAVAVTNLGAG